MTKVGGGSGAPVRSRRTGDVLLFTCHEDWDGRVEAGRGVHEVDERVEAATGHGRPAESGGSID